MRFHLDEHIDHAGIVFCLRRSRTIGEIVRHLVLMHDCLADSDMHGRIEFL